MSLILRARTQEGFKRRKDPTHATAYSVELSNYQFVQPQRCGTGERAEGCRLSQHICAGVPTLNEPAYRLRSLMRLEARSDTRVPSQLQRRDRTSPSDVPVFGSSNRPTLSCFGVLRDTSNTCQRKPMHKTQE